MPRLPPVLSASDLPVAELMAARLDGELFPVDDCFVPIDEIEGPAHRARALRAGLTDRTGADRMNPERLIAERRSAAWVWGALDLPPAVHELCVTVDSRVVHSAATWVAVREVVITPGEIAHSDGFPVTTAMRTAIDIARVGETFGDTDARTIGRLMAIGGFGAGDCLAEMDRRRNLPGKHRALLRLTRSEGRAQRGDQPEFTRYTS